MAPEPFTVLTCAILPQPFWANWIAGVPWATEPLLTVIDSQRKSTRSAQRMRFATEYSVVSWWSLIIRFEFDDCFVTIRSLVDLITSV